MCAYYGSYCLLAWLHLELTKTQDSGYTCEEIFFFSLIKSLEVEMSSLLPGILE